jgi:hypothetical protein
VVILNAVIPMKLVRAKAEMTFYFHYKGRSQKNITIFVCGLEDTLFWLPFLVAGYPILVPSCRPPHTSILGSGGFDRCWLSNIGEQPRIL